MMKMSLKTLEAKISLTRCQHIIGWRCVSKKKFGVLVILHVLAKVGIKKEAICILGWPVKEFQYMGDLDENVRVLGWPKHTLSLFVITINALVIYIKIKIKKREKKEALAGQPDPL